MNGIRALMKRSNSFGFRRLHLFKTLGLVIVIVSFVFPTPSRIASAQRNDSPWYEVRSIHTADYALKNPQGMAFSSNAKAFLAWDGDGNVTGIGLNEDVINTVGLKIPVEDAKNVAFNEHTKGLFVLRNGNTQIEEFGVNNNGLPEPLVGPIRSDNLQAINLRTPHGIAFDPINGRLFILDQEGNQLVIVTPGTNSGFDGNAAIRESRVKRINLRALGYSDLQGVALNPGNGNLYLSDPANHKLYGITQAGKMVSTYDLSPLQLVNPVSMIFAASVDATDDRTRMNLFILDSGRTVATSEVPTSSSQTISSNGRIVELALVALPAAPSNQLPTTLINTINTSNTAWNPSSPDTSGVVYWPAHNTLLMSDSEVDEMPPYWVGKNVFESTLSGSLVSTCTTYPGFSREPSGISINPDNNHIFFSDDDANRISEVGPGSDRIYCTSDDTVTYVNILQAYNIDDAEDVAYAQNTIFIAGGTDAEVYMFGLGPNKVIGGGDDGPLAHFDTSSLGFQDLEGVGYNPDRGTLFIISTQSSDRYLGEVTTSGTLLYAYNLAYLGGVPRSSINYAPSSQNPLIKNVYIASRGVDNGVDPNENDGKVWEISLGGSQVTVTPNLTQAPTRTQTRTLTPTFTPTFTPPAGVSTNPLYISLTNDGTVGGVAFADEDILRFDGRTWSLFFDGSDVGLGSTDTFGFSVLNANTILFSFSSAVTLGGLAVTPQDIVRFDATSLGSVTAGTFSMYLNGVDVGLDTTYENIDSISILADGRILVSTTGDPSVPGLTGADEDILAFTPTTLGDITIGTWAMYFDGSDVSLSDSSNEDIDALDVRDGNIYLSTLGNFSVNGVLGADEDIFICSPTSLGSVTACNYSPSLYFDGSTWGIDANDVDAFNFLALGVPTTTPTSTPAPTSTASMTPTKTATSTSTPTYTNTASMTPTKTATFTSTATYTSIASITPTPTATSTSAPTYTNTASMTPTPTATSTSTPTYTSIASITPTPTATLTFTPTETITPSTTPSPTDIPSPTPMPAPTSTASMTPSPTDILTFTLTPTSTPTYTNTASMTPTPTATLTFTPTETITPSTTPSPTDIPSPTPMPAPTSTASVTPSPTDIPSPTPTPWPTSTASIIPTPTLTFTVTMSLTPQQTPTASITPSSTTTFTHTPTLVQPNRPFYLSLDTGGRVGGVTAEDVDILYFNGTSWSLFFDASDVGISTSGQDVNDFQIINSNTLLITFDTATTLGTLTVDPWDVVQFNATSLGSVTSGTFSMYLDGNDVGLDTTSEVIDALDVLPDGRVLISTMSTASVPGVSAADEDILAFTPTTLGDTTSGSWAIYFDGSDVGLADSSSEDVSSLDITSNGDIYLSTLGDFSVPGLSGANEDIFVCIPTSIGDITACNYLPSLYFDGSNWALDSNFVDGVHIP